MYIGLGAKLISPTLLILSKNGGKLCCDRQNCVFYICYCLEKRHSNTCEASSRWTSY